jgi:hypothetical protein
MRPCTDKLSHPTTGSLPMRCERHTNATQRATPYYLEYTVSSCKPVVLFQSQEVAQQLDAQWLQFLVNAVKYNSEKWAGL